jgi:hypothetical protein
MSATKKIPATTRGVKAHAKKGKVTRTAKKPELTDEQIDQLVQQTLAEQSLLSRAGSLVSDTLTALGTGVLIVCETIADAVKRIAAGVWAFLGRVYSAVSEAVQAMVAWIKEQANAAYGQAKKALTAVHELVGSMNVSDVNVGLLKLVAAAAAIGVGTAVGLAAGVATGGVVASFGAGDMVIRATAILFAACTGYCVSGVVYGLSLGGLPTSTLARILPAVEAKVKAMKANKAAVAAA